jgi:hypothetical protein
MIKQTMFFILTLLFISVALGNGTKISINNKCILVEETNVIMHDTPYIYINKDLSCIIQVDNFNGTKEFDKLFVNDFQSKSFNRIISNVAFSSNGSICYGVLENNNYYLFQDSVVIHCDCNEIIHVDYSPSDKIIYFTKHLNKIYFNYNSNNSGPFDTIDYGSLQFSDNESLSFVATLGASKCIYLNGRKVVDIDKNSKYKYLLYGNNDIIASYLYKGDYYIYYNSSVIGPANDNLLFAYNKDKSDFAYIQPAADKYYIISSHAKYGPYRIVSQIQFSKLNNKLFHVANIAKDGKNTLYSDGKALIEMDTIEQIFISDNGDNYAIKGSSLNQLNNKAGPEIIIQNGFRQISFDNAENVTFLPDGDVLLTMKTKENKYLLVSLMKPKQGNYNQYDKIYPIAYSTNESFYAFWAYRDGCSYFIINDKEIVRHGKLLFEGNPIYYGKKVIRTIGFDDTTDNTRSCYVLIKITW